MQYTDSTSFSVSNLRLVECVDRDSQSERGSAKRLTRVDERSAWLFALLLLFSLLLAVCPEPKVVGGSEHLQDERDERGQENKVRDDDEGPEQDRAEQPEAIHAAPTSLCAHRKNPRIMYLCRVTACKQTICT
eukprot:617123-Pleurochrysis_carterae.AAC.2